MSSIADSSGGRAHGLSVQNRTDLPDTLITATILGLAAQIEREFISARTKEALARRKAAGLPVGRPKGRATKLMLDDRRAEIVDYLNKGVSKRSVAKILGCSPTTLYSWIRRRHIYVLNAYKWC